MRPYRVIDPRSPLDRVNRDQMREFAERNGITEITWDMMGDEMRYILRKKGINDIGEPFQILGTKSTMVIKADNDPTVPTMSLEDLQKQQWEQRAKEREQMKVAEKVMEEDRPILEKLADKPKKRESALNQNPTPQQAETIVRKRAKSRKLGKNQIAVIEALRQQSLSKREVASFLHSGNLKFSEWVRPSKSAFGAAARLMDVLEVKGLIEPAGDSDKTWRKKYKLTDKVAHGQPHAS